MVPWSTQDVARLRPFRDQAAIEAAAGSDSTSAAAAGQPGGLGEGAPDTAAGANAVRAPAIDPNAPGTPEHPVYLMRVPSRRDLLAFRRAVRSEAGTRYPGQAELYLAMREGVAAIAPANAAALLAAIELAETTEVRRTRGEEVDERGFADLMRQVGEIEATLEELWSPYAALTAARKHFLELSSLIAFEMFITGAEGRTILRDRGRVDAAALDRIEAEHPHEIEEIGLQIVGLLQPSKAAEKNSASPSPSR